MQKDYDRYYEILRLQPGVGLSEVERAWKYWAPFLHPDNFAAGPLQDRASNELKILNDARDQLRNWWNSNAGPPPTKRHAPPPQPKPEPPPQPKPQPKPAPDQKGPESKPPPDDKTWQEQAYDDWKHQQERGGSANQDAPRPKAPPKPFGPPRFVKSWNHHIYDVMDSNREDASAFAIFFWIAFALGPFIVGGTLLSIVTAIFNIPPGPVNGYVTLALILAVAIPFWLMTIADKTIYTIEVNPYLQACLLPANEVMEKITRLVEGTNTADRKWELASTDLVAQDNILSKNWVMSFQDGDRKYRILLNVRVLRNEPDYQSMVSYWFNIDAAVDWRLPVAKVVKATDEALWKGLKK
jgi:hypothetical protein